MVREMVPEEGRLLEADLKEGWAPLCEFLEVDVPGDEMERANDSATAAEGIMRRVVVFWWLGWGFGGLCGASASLICKSFKGVDELLCYVS